MIRMFTAIVVVLFATPVMADTGSQWFEALQKRNVKAALAVTVPGGLQYGNKGNDKVIQSKIKRLYKKVFSKLRRPYKQAVMEKKSCTEAARELGYMAREWREKNSQLSIWIGQINTKFCTGEGLFPPKVWLAQIMVEDMPHAIVVYDTGEDNLIDAVFHF